MTVQTALYPPAGSLCVLPPCIAKALLKLSLFAPNHEIDEWEVQDGERRPPGVPRINEVPEKMKTFPPRYRGFLEKRYGPVVMR